MRDWHVLRQVKHAAGARRRTPLRAFAASESGAVSAEFVVIVATAISLSLLITAKVGVATGAIMVNTGHEMEQAERAAAPVSAEGCAVEVNGPGEGGAILEGC